MAHRTRSAVKNHRRCKRLSFLARVIAFLFRKPK